MNAPPDPNSLGSPTKPHGWPSSAWRKVADYLEPVLDHLKAIPPFFRRLGAKLARLKPPERVWTFLMGVVALAVGGILVVAPARELATGKNFDLRSLITLAWLLTGLGTLAGGLGILFKLRSFRWQLQLAFITSVPLAGAFVYRTVSLAMKMRKASGSTREVLETWVSGGIQLSAFVVGVSIYLFFLINSGPLKRLYLSVGRSRPMVSAIVGAVFGCGFGFLVWIVFRWLGFFQNIEWFIDVVYQFPVEHFICGGAILGAAVSALIALVWK